MLRSINGITGYKLAALDGEIGSCKDVLFDDRFWTVRYLVADTGRWLPGRKVLIAPQALGEPDWASKAIPVLLTQEQIEDAPPIDEHAPVSRQYEKMYFAYYGWPQYWVGAYAGHTGMLATPAGAEPEPEPFPEEGDPNLRSADEVSGYYIHARDGDVGHVEDFVLDVGTWIIRYMVVDTRNWLPGRKVLVAPAWIERVDWSEKRVHVDLPREAIKNSPEYNPSEPVNRKYEERLYDYYGEPVYW